MTSGWLERVAERAGIAIKEADAILTKRGVRPERTLRPGPGLTLQRVAFRGEKAGHASGEFQFDWAGLGPGVWAVASEGNLVGKSTILEVVLWCLRGEPRTLQADVRRWLSQVSISFGFGGQNYQIEFETGVRHFSGALYSVDRQLHRSVRDRFSSEPGFAAVMAGFMMQMLDLDPIPSHQSAGADDGQSVEHGWPALAGALYFGGDHKLLLGDVKWGGLPARMLQMYVGMPWARTVMQATTAHKEAVLEEQRSSRARSHSTAFDVTTRERIERELRAPNESKGWSSRLP